MGTRADFYVASGEDRMNLQLEYLGSIGCDGSEIEDVAFSTTEEEFRERTLAFLKERNGAKFPKINSMITDCVYVWVPGIGIVQRHEDDEEDFMARLDRKVDDGTGIYVSYTLEQEWHKKGMASADEETGDYTIPEWDDYYGFQEVCKVEGIRYCYPDNRENDGLVERYSELPA